MTIEIDGMDIVPAIELAVFVGGIISVLVITLLVYLLVRPPRHVREAKRRPVEMEANEAEALLRLMERMQARLDVLERALPDQDEAENGNHSRILERAEDSRQDRRKT
jgi:large-conductance mechanosensitive channel